MSDEGLKPCPFCGCDLNEYPKVMIFEKVSRQILPDVIYIKCPHCSASGSSGWNKEEANAKWNRRVSTSS